MVQTKLLVLLQELGRKLASGGCVLLLALFSVPPAQAENSGETSGGVYLILEPRINEAHEAYFDIIWPKVRATMVAERDIVGFVRRERHRNGKLYVLISEPEGARHAWEKVSDLLAAESELPDLSNAKFDVRIEGLRLTIGFQEATSGQIGERIISQIIEVVRARMVEFEISGVQVTPFGSQFIQILAVDIASTDNFLALMETPANLVVSPVVGRTSNSQSIAGPGSELLPDRYDQSTFFVVESRNILTNQDFLTFERAFDLNGRPAINFRLSEVGTQALDDYIKNEPNGLAAFVLDGEVVSVMMNNRVRIPSNEGTIIGEFTLAEADRLARLLNVGSFPVGLDIVQHREISPPLAISQ